MPGYRTRATVGAVTRMRSKGRLEMVVDSNDPEFQAGRWEFADTGDLTGYLGEVFGIQPSGNGGISGSMSRKGRYVRRRPDGTRAFTFGDPILDQITSATGEIVIARRSLDLTRPSIVNPDGQRVAAKDLILTGEEGGVERWISEDGTKVEYRTAGASLTFTASKKSTFYGYWSMGAEITTRGGNFEAANINSRYYGIAYAQVCGVEYDSDSDTNDDHVDEYEWGWNSPQPVRVESLCRAQWNGERYADVVGAGGECYALDVQPFPTGWPDEWPPDTGVEVRPDRLTMRVRSIGLTARATVTVVNHDPSEVTVVVEDADGVRFSNPTGSFTVPANDALSITVTFLGAAVGVYRSRVRIVAGGRSFEVPITATVTQVGEPL